MRENRRDNDELTIQRHCVHKTNNKQKKKQQKTNNTEDTKDGQNEPHQKNRIKHMRSVRVSSSCFF